MVESVRPLCGERGGAILVQLGDCGPHSSKRRWGLDWSAGGGDEGKEWAKQCLGGKALPAWCWVGCGGTVRKRVVRVPVMFDLPREQRSVPRTTHSVTQRWGLSVFSPRLYPRGLPHHWCSVNIC